MQRWVWTNDYQGYFTRFCAVGILVAVPIAILFIMLTEYYVEGVTSGAIKELICEHWCIYKIGSHLTADFQL